MNIKNEIDMKKNLEMVIWNTKQQCNIHDVRKSACSLKYQTTDCERYNVVKSCKHCPWEETIC